MYRTDANSSPVAHDIEQESNSVMMQYLHYVIIVYVWVYPCQAKTLAFLRGYRYKGLCIIIIGWAVSYLYQICCLTEQLELKLL